MEIINSEEQMSGLGSPQNNPEPKKEKRKEGKKLQKMNCVPVVSMDIRACRTALKTV